jgi:hypothetical protein
MACAPPTALDGGSPASGPRAPSHPDPPDRAGEGASTNAVAVRRDLVKSQASRPRARISSLDLPDCRASRSNLALLWTSGVLMPISRTRSEGPFLRRTWMLSPSITRVTRAWNRFGGLYRADACGGGAGGGRGG